MNTKIKRIFTEYQNSHFDVHLTKVSFRLSVIAASGLGETQYTFGHIYVCYRISELFFEFMQKQICADTITIITQLAILPLIN